MDNKWKIHLNYFHMDMFNVQISSPQTIKLYIYIYIMIQFNYFNIKRINITIFKMFIVKIKFILKITILNYHILLY